MHWFFIALLAPFFWSISNHTDKFLLNRYLSGVGKGALILYSTLFGAVVMPVAYIIDKDIFNISLFSVFILIFAGILSSLAIYFYLFALEDEETSIVMPFFQFIPVTGYFLGMFLLGETLTKNQLIGSATIVFGALILSINIDEIRHLKFRFKTFILTFISSLFFASYEVLFKVVAVEDGFWVSSFWQYFGLLIFGLFLLVFVDRYRSDFINLLRKHTFKFFSINVLNETTTIIGNMFSNFALLLAPVALVMTVTGYQPIIVFLEGIVLTILFPRFAKEKITHKHLAHKILSIAIVFIGTILIYN